MFHRKRAVSNPPRHQQNTAPTPSAALAASQAFLKSQPSNASLSAAAATAALRSQTSSPVPVARIQTKRMQRRNSGSSLGSGDGGIRPGVERRNSHGSMTERTFRSPSPSRGSPLPDDAPPVPAIPKNVPSIPQKSHRRTASLEPAPLRVGSPPPRAPGGRGGSVDRGSHYQKGSHAAERGASNLQKLTEAEPEGSNRGSVNFSYPRSPSGSPAPTPVKSNKASHSGWFTSPVIGEERPRGEAVGRPKTAEILPPHQAYGIQQSVQNAADRPVTKKKKKRASGAEGSHLAGITAGSKPMGTVVLDHTPSQTALPSSPKPTPVKAVPASFNSDSPSSTISSTASDTPVSEHPRSFSTRAAGLLAKQPSVVRENPELEAQEEQAATVANTGRKVESCASQPTIDYNRSAPSTIAPAQFGMREQQRLRASSLGTPSNTRPGRSNSLSPGRAAHFSSVPVEMANGVKHHPPPRSVSPAKSALKHSPSSSVRAISPVTSSVAGHGRGAPSETSEDTASQTPKRKKKSVRVSFEERPTTVGLLTGLESSAHHQQSSTGKSQDVDNVDLDEIMKPTPALPSFGSVRGRKKYEQDQEPAEKVTETVSSSLSNSVSTVSGLDHSNDHAVGGVLARAFAKKNFNYPQEPVMEERKQLDQFNEPLPPEVTSVEGSGYISDSESDSSQTQAIEPIPEHTFESLPTTEKHSLDGVEGHNLTGKPLNSLADSVPSIAILPATPAAIEQEGAKQLHNAPAEVSTERAFFIPGSFPESSTEVYACGLPDTQETHARLIGTTVDGEVDELPTNSPVRSITPPVLASLVFSGDTDDETSDTGDSIYSDAEEDLSDTEGGFASLDAIVESPVVKSSPDTSTAMPLSSPTAAHLPQEQDTVEPLNQVGNWEGTKAYWSGLSDQKRRDIENSAQPETTQGLEHTNNSVTKAPVSKPKKKKTARVAPQPVAVSTPYKPTVNKQSPQPRQAVMRSSMRVTSNEPFQETHMRKSMRSGGTMQSTMRAASEELQRETHMRKSMRAGSSIQSTTRGSSANAGLSTSRYASPPPETRETHTYLQKQQKQKVPPVASLPVSTAAALGTLQSQGTMKPGLKRKDSSDSESSFRRRRPSGSTVDSGRYNMRRSMRGAAQTAPPPIARTVSPTMRHSSPTPAPGKSKRFSIRSMSPAGSLARKPKAPEQLRSSMRTSMDSGAPTMRSQKPAKQRSAMSPSRLGFGKGSKKPTPQAKPTPVSAGPRFKSRFVDSSDEEDARPAFRSRFADSDDEPDSPVARHVPAGLTPVRGIPRRRGQEEGDSTDLDDSEESDVEKPRQRPPVPLPADVEKAIGPTIPAAVNTQQGNALAAGSLRGLDSSKHAPHTNGISSTISGPALKAKRGFFGLGKRKNSTQGSVNLDSAPPLDRAQSPPRTPRSPKLQRRSSAQPTPPPPPPQLVNSGDSESWPLPPNLGSIVEREERPATSDGVAVGGVTAAGIQRPDIGNRRVTVDGKGREVAWGRGGKKKKFMGLRRVFGLND